MSQFTFTLDSFQITQTMAKHKDTDWVYFTLRVGGQTFGPTHKKIGDLNNGTFPLNWHFGPVEVAPTDLVVMTYQIVNHGHSDTGTQVSNDIAIAAKISAGVAGISAATFPPAAVVLGAITGGLGIVSELVSWIFGDGPNCDGIVLSDAISTNGAGLQQMLHGSDAHTENRKYIGPETPQGCGPDAQYSVTWSIRQLVTLPPIHPTPPITHR